VLGYFLNVALLYIVIGFSAALIYSLILRKQTIGGFWGALGVSIVGAFLGAVFDYFFKDVIYFLSHINETVNIFPPVISSFIFLWVFVTISRSGNREDD